MQKKLSSNMVAAIEALRKWKGDSFAVESYTDSIGKLFNKRRVTHRMICNPDLSFIKGNTLIALFDRGWLQIVEIIDMEQPTWLKKTKVIRYRFVDLDF